MVNVFGTVVGFASFFQSRPQGDIKIDNVAFRLHYDFTTGFFFLATALLSLNDMFGSNIQCRGYDSKGGVAEAPGAVTQYCWVSGTFTVPGVKEIHETMQGIGHAGQAHYENLCKQKLQRNEKTEEGTVSGQDHAGKTALFKIFQYDTDDELSRVNWDNLTDYEDEITKIPLCKKTHSYYQWVPFLFVFQGFLFMIPHKIWETLEEGKMKAISEGVAVGNKQKNASDRQEIVANVTKYIVKEAKTLGHKKYAYGFWSCLILNLINAIFNFILLDIFIGGEFRNLGVRWLQASGVEDDKLLKEIFPRMTNCLWKQHGTAGHYETRLYMCILATNIVTEKVFVFLWFWLTFLIFNSACVALYYGLLLFSNNEGVRYYFLAFAVKTTRKKIRYDDKHGTLEQEINEGKKVNKYLSKLPSTNFFFLYCLANNVDYSTLQDILRAVSEKSKEIVEADGPARKKMYPEVGHVDEATNSGMEMKTMTEAKASSPSAPPSPDPVENWDTSKAF